MGAMPPQTIEFADQAPLRAEGTAVVAATPAELWAVLIDTERWPTWFGSSLKKARVTSAQAMGVGATREVVLQGGMTVAETFIVWDEERTWAFTGTSVSPPAFKRLVERCSIEPVDDTHTRVTYRMAAELSPLLRPISRVVAATATKTLTAAMVNLGDEAVRRRG